MTFEAIIFDLDGTLLNTLNDLADSVNTVLENEGYPTHPVEAYKIFVGNGLPNLLRQALPEKQANNKNIIDDAVAKVKAEYATRWDKKTRPYNGVDEMLNELKNKNVKMAILSNKPHDFMLQVVDKYFDSEMFYEIFGLRDDVPAKPDPAGALEIAEKMNLSPKDIAFLGDSNTDMKTATSAGMTPIGALWGFRTKDELEQYGAKYLISEPKEILGILS